MEMSNVSTHREAGVPQMRFAYADPPYLGCAARLYGDATYDSLDAHKTLIDSLAEYDGWAYSLSSTTLYQLLPLCPPDVRVGAWVKPFASFKPNVNPGYVWEPVIFHGGRPFTRYDDTIRDWCSANITLKKGLAGAKPYDFSVWIFRLLNMKPHDEFHDIFPGTGIVTEAWRSYQQAMAAEPEQLTLEAICP